MAKLSDLKIENELLRQQIVSLKNRLLQNYSEQETSSRLFTVFSNDTPVAQLVVDIESQLILGANPAFCSILGYEPKDLVGFSTIEANLWNSPEEQSKIIGQLIKTGKVENAEIHFKHRSGQSLTFLTSFQIIEMHGIRICVSSAFDITHRKEMEVLLDKNQRHLQNIVQELQQSRNTLQLIIDSIPVRIFWKDKNLRYIGCNRLFAQDTGFENPQELIGKDDFALSWKEQAEGYRKDDMEVITSRRPKVNIIETLTRTSGETIWLRTNKVPLFEVDGSLTGILGVYEDITHQRYLEEQLAEKQKILESVTGMVPDMVYLYHTQQQRYLYFNIGINDFLGSSRTDIDHIWDEQFMQKIHPDDFLSAKEHVDMMLSVRDDDIYKSQYRIKKDSGEYLWLLVRERVYQRNADGQTEVIFGVCQDITEREISNEKLRINERTLKLFVEYAPAAIAMFDRNMNYIAVSHRFLSDYRLTDQKIIGRNHYDIFPEISERWKDIHQRCLNGATIKADEDPFPRSDGSMDWVRWEVHPWYEDTSQIGGILLLSEVITERKEAREKLFQSEQHLRTILQTSNDGFWINDDTGHFLDVNDAYCMMSGYTRDELLKMKISDIKAFEPSAESARHLPQIKQNRHDQFESRHRRKDGSVFNVEVSVSYLDINGGEMICFCHDITQRKHAEESLRNSEEKYRKLSEELERRVIERTAEVQDIYDNAPVGYCSLDANARFSRINQTILKWLGYKYEEMLGESILDFIPSESVALFQNSFSLFKINGYINEVELDFICKDGKKLPVSISATAIYDDQGSYLNSRTTLQEISSRKAAELALRESEEHNRLLFEESPDAISLMDKNGKLTRVNHAYETLAKASRESLLGKNIFELQIMSSEDASYFNETFVRSISNQGTLETAEFTLVLSDGTKVNVESHFFVIQFGGSNHVMVTTRDITSRKQAEEALWHANNEMGRAMRMRDEFMASMSHELRTPLTGILGLSEALQELVYGPLNEKQLKALGDVENSGRHLLELINDILDVSKLEAGKLELQIQNCNLNQICQSSLQLIKGMAQKKSQKFEYNISPPEILFQADHRRVKQIIVNLLSNAVKYTNYGEKFGLEVIGNEADRSIRITVWDNGIGIKDEDLHKLFQPFFQLDSSLSRQQTGTGLGLTLVSSLTELHGGSVFAESTFGKGSRFSVILPWVLPDIFDNTSKNNTAIPKNDDSTDNHAGDSNEQMTIMIVDDNEINIQMISDYLSSKNFRVSIARNGWEFFDQIPRVQPQIILMDIQMPEMDGLNVIQRIRNHQDARIAATPIIAMTALAMPGDREKCISAGANEYISKPVKLSDLIHIIYQIHNAPD